MKRRLEFVREGGAALMTLYRVAGTERLVMAITDFGHDYRNSFWAIWAGHRAQLLAHFHEKAFAERVGRQRSDFASQIPAAKLSYDDATKSYFLSDDDEISAAHVP